MLTKVLLYLIGLRPVARLFASLLRNRLIVLEIAKLAQIPITIVDPQYDKGKTPLQAFITGLRTDEEAVTIQYCAHLTPLPSGGTHQIARALRLPPDLLPRTTLQLRIFGDKTLTADF
jgi:hypothetical protein